jgi:hypothetical protein
MKIHKLMILCVSMLVPLAAQAHESEGHDGEEYIIAKGSITAISGVAVTIADKTFTLTENTKFEGMNDQLAALSDFSVGTYAKAKGSMEGDSLIARELELENAEHPHGKDDSKKSSSDDSVVSRCEFPNLNLVRKALERNIKDSLLEQGISSKVSVKAKIVSRDEKQVLSATAAANGIALSSSANNLVELTGSVLPQECAGIARFKIKVKGTRLAEGTSIVDSFSSELGIQGMRVVGGKK